MRLRRIHIKNFRAIRDAQIELGQQTALLGANGTGKSTVLRAIDRFYSSSAAVELDDFFGRQVDQPIEIVLTFSEFSDSERDLFGSRIHDNEMTIARVFYLSTGKTSGRYYGVTKQHQAFVVIRQTSGANPKREAYTRLREQPEYTTLPAVRNAGEIEPILAQWELDHPEQCALERDDGQFFGFTNVGRGNLQKATAFVFIPAVRDVSADAIDSRGTVIARLMELVVRSAVQRRGEIRAFQMEVSERYRQLTDPENLHELGDLAEELTRTLKFFYGDTAVNLRWKASEELALPLPTSEVSIHEDGFEGPVDRKGHGLQRAFILTLLQHMAKAVSVENVRTEQEQAAAADPPNVAPNNVTPEVTPIMPGLILAIEEPELYQHPTKQRHFSSVLTQLSDGSLPGVATQTQILFASHSPLFVAMDRFDEVHLARRHTPNDSEHRECFFSDATLADVAGLLERAQQKPAGTFTADSLRPRLHIIDSEITEGFFSDIAVLVEGPSDKAAILAAARLNDIDLEALGIAVLPVGGKNNLDKPGAIFLSLGIPTIIIWDCDRKGTAIDHLETNKALQRLCGLPEESLFDAATMVGESFACFESKLEKTLKEEIGEELFNKHLDAVTTMYSIVGRDDAQKVPSVMAEVLALASKEGGRSVTLDNIVAAIRAAREKSAG